MPFWECVWGICQNSVQIGNRYLAGYVNQIKLKNPAIHYLIGTKTWALNW
jgi:hypothetical protein